MVMCNHHRIFDFRDECEKGLINVIWNVACGKGSQASGRYYILSMVPIFLEDNRVEAIRTSDL